MKKTMNALWLLSVLIIQGCATQGGHSDYMSTDTGSVTVQRGNKITLDERYEDPLYYYHNDFDSLYFN